MAKKATAKTPLKSPSLDHEHYNYIVDGASLQDVKLISLYFDVQPDFFIDRESVSLSVSRKALEFGGLEDGMASAFFEFAVRAKIDDEEVMQTNANYMTVYAVPEDAKGPELAEFCNRVGLLAAYPYFRALFAHLAADSDLNVPVLPLVISPPVRSKVIKKSVRSGKQTAAKGAVVKAKAQQTKVVTE